MWELFGTETANTTAYWKPSPPERGTLNILSSCVITLILCAYTSLHLDIPEHGKATFRRKFWAKAFWVVVGLGAPDIVAFIAFRQLLFARNFQRELTGVLGPLLPQSKKSSTPIITEDASCHIEDGTQITQSTDHHAGTRRIFPWTKVHSHFALMGGFAFDTSNLPVNILPYGRTRLTLTANALRTLAASEPDLIPDISEETIRDKSKSNDFAKILVCLQACWFIIQVIGRLAKSSAISLLELNTLLHALCCLFIYLAWYRKPHDIDEPVLISTSTDLARKVCAWMVMESMLGRRRQADDGRKSVHGYLLYDDDVRRQEAKHPSQWEWLQPMLKAAQDHNESLRRPEQVHSTDDNMQASSVASKQNTALKLYPGQMAHGFRFLFRFGTEAAQYPMAYIGLTLGDMECLRLAKELRIQSSADTSWQSTLTGVYHGRNMLVTRTSVADSPDDTGSLESFVGSTWLTRQFPNYAMAVFWAGWLVAGSAYGATHLLAWNGTFTTQAERWMWRTSCLLIACPVVIALLAAMLIYVLKGIVWLLKILITSMERRKAFPWLTTEIRLYYPVILGEDLHSPTVRDIPFYLVLGPPVVGISLIGWALLIAYPVARVYIIVECFINLAHLPAAVYQQPNWVQYIPHFGSG